MVWQSVIKTSTNPKTLKPFSIVQKNYEKALESKSIDQISHYNSSRSISFFFPMIIRATFSRTLKSAPGIK